MGERVGWEERGRGELLRLQPSPDLIQAGAEGTHPEMRSPGGGKEGRGRPRLFSANPSLPPQDKRPRPSPCRRG